MIAEEAKRVRDAVIEHLSHGRQEAGARLFEESEARLPEPVRLECLGAVHFYRRELQEAARCYEAAIAIAPDNVIARYQYLVGTQEEREGNLVEAFKRYQAAIDAEPAFVDPYVELGGLLVKVQDFEGAAQCYRDAVRIDPSDAANYHNLIAVLRRLAQTDSNRYGAELASVEGAYAEIARSGDRKELSDHQW